MQYLLCQCVRVRARVCVLFYGLLTASLGPTQFTFPIKHCSSVNSSSASHEDLRACFPASPSHQCISALLAARVLLIVKFVFIYLLTRATNSTTEESMFVYLFVCLLFL